MTISRLEIANVRNLQSVSLLPHPQLNLFVGQNGSGKTSVLEALYLLGLGRSFRSGRVRRLINDNASQCTVFVAFAEGGGAGIQRNANGESQFRLDGRSNINLADIAHRLPLSLLDPASFAELQEGSKPRRAQLDWGVFHVEHRFYPSWVRYQRALKQRNSLLRSGNIQAFESGAWDQELAETAALLHAFRLAHLSVWVPVWESVIESFLPGFPLTLEYHAGWDTDKALDALLADSWLRDLERGHTQIGPHRADLRIKLGTAPADEVLSRGQLKLALCALKLSQITVLRDQGIQSLILIDDLASELDAGARSRLLGYLGGTAAQIFITAIDSADLMAELQGSEKGFRMFHVEHGTITEF
ncbi:MAG TPA: DNA replication/repair protein RecF [Moraxellaceae bacterium]|nr:DNA replication/repair protein RecF [Moraxellaceae bacterium]